MVPIYIGSTRGYSGKSLVTLGLGLKMKDDGFRTGYMKPYGRIPVIEGGTLVDGDATFMKRTLGLPDPIEDVCPVVYTQDLVADTMRGKDTGARARVQAAFGRLSRDRDALLIVGARDIFDGLAMGISGSGLVSDMDARAVIVDPFDGELSVDNLLAARDILGDRMIGAVINKVHPDGMDYVREMAGPFLGRKGIALLGVLPADRLLGSVSIDRLVETLGGKVLCCADKTDELVENFMIGAMDVDSALKYFRRTANKAVITGGHRPDIQLAALETSTKCLILTGGTEPNELIISKAIERGVPVISVGHDTMTAVELFEGELGKVRIRDRKLGRAKELMDEHFDYGAFYRAAGLARS